MNSIHDMGGMDGFGPVEREENEPVFHAEWERRAFALSMAMGRLFGPIDKRRHALERMDPGHYLRTTYYERWLRRMENDAEQMGILSEEEIAGGAVKEPWPATDPPPAAGTVAAIVRAGASYTRDTGRLEPRFAIGDRVRARNIHPPGHTRLPRYARGHIGTVVRCHGTHVFPDSNAHGKGEDPQPLYSVRFTASELWGPDATSGDHVYLDLWEDYLETVEAGDE